MGEAQEISIPGRYECISDACGFVVNGATKAGFNEDDLFQIELACDEACTNVIEHSYGAENVGELRVSWAFDESHFIISIYDNGRPFNPTEVPTPNVPDDSDHLEQLKIGGLGLHFMRKLMDEVRFSYDKGHGNRLVMIKYRGGASS